MANKTILLHPRDNVATALTPLQKGETVNATLDAISVDVTLLEEIQFGHKLALRDIAEGEEVLKFGMPIGRALKPIHAGEWVHVHNCRSHRWGFHNDQYGINA